MTITVTNIVAGPFTATGAAQVLPFAFMVFTAAEVEVYSLASGVETVVDPSNYVVAMNEAVDGSRIEGGTVTYTTTAGLTLYVRAKPSRTQNQVWTNLGSRLSNLNEALDRAVLVMLRVQYDLTRGIGSFEDSEAAALAASAAAVAAQVDVQQVYADILALQAAGDHAAALATRVPKNTDGTDFSQPEAVVQNLVFLQSGGRNRGLREKVRETVSIADFIGADDNARMAAALASSNIDLYIPPAGLDITTPITSAIAHNKRLWGPGTIRFTGTGRLVVGGGTSALPALAANLTPASASATFATAHGLSVGDVFGVHNRTDFSFAPHRDYYQDGQMFFVTAVVSPTVVRFGGRVRRTFTTAAVSCFKLAGGRFDLDGVSLAPSSGTTAPAITIDGCVGVRVNDLRVAAGAGYTAVEILRCFDFTVSNPRSQAFASDAYPLAIVNSQKGVIYGGTGLYSTRHGISMGGRAGLGCVPTADVQVIGGIYQSDPSTGVGSIDSHGNCEDITFSGCKVYQSANMGGRNITLNDCDLYGRAPGFDASENAVFAREPVGGRFELNRCRFHVTGSNGSLGLLYFLTGPVLSAGVPDTTNLKEDLRIVLNDCEVVSTGSMADVRFLWVDVGPSSWSGFRVDMEINDLRWPRGAAAPFLLALVTGANDVSALASLTWRGGDRLPAGTAPFYAGSPNAAIPVRHDLVLKGTTANRPANPMMGQVYFDTTLVAVTGKPVKHNGAAWIDGDGASV